MGVPPSAAPRSGHTDETIADATLRQATTAYRGSANPDGAAVLASFRSGAAHAVLLKAGFLDVTT